MKRFLLLPFAMLVLFTWSPRLAHPEAADAIRFEAVNVYIDSGPTPLAAYQFELKTTGRATLVGLEGGESPAFSPAPYYDTHALLNDRVIVAALSTLDELPRGRTRVARVMVRITGPEPKFEASLTVAASSDGKPMDARVSAEVVKPENISPEGAKQ